jgi:hypothetical protein
MHQIQNKKVNIKPLIEAEDLYTQSEALAKLNKDRTVLNAYVNQGKIQRVKSTSDKRCSYYFREQIDSLTYPTEEFYIQEVK